MSLYGKFVRCLSRSTTLFSTPLPCLLPHSVHRELLLSLPLSITREMQALPLASVLSSDHTGLFENGTRVQSRPRQDFDIGWTEELAMGLRLASELRPFNGFEKPRIFLVRSDNMGVVSVVNRSCSW